MLAPMLKQRVLDFLEDALMCVLGFLPLILMALVGVAIMVLPSILGLSGWIASPTVLFGWWFLGRTCWLYEAWRASGPRGIFINTCGTTRSTFINLLWPFIGLLLLLINAMYRRGWIRADLQKLELKLFSCFFRPI
jgi:hypothetical protein